MINSKDSHTVAAIKEAEILKIESAFGLNKQKNKRITSDINQNETPRGSQYRDLERENRYENSYKKRSSVAEERDNANYSRRDISRSKDNRTNRIRSRSRSRHRN